MNQRTMVADHLQPAMVVCHSTVTDVADGFQRICNRNELIFRCTDFRCRCVCDSIWQFSILSSRGALRRRISCTSTYYSLLYVHEILRFALDDKTKSPYYMSCQTSKRVKGDSSTRQGALMNSSRSFHQNIKDFFKKFFIFLKKSCQVFEELFLRQSYFFFSFFSVNIGR